MPGEDSIALTGETDFFFYIPEPIDFLEGPISHTQFIRLKMEGGVETHRPTLSHLSCNIGI